MQIVPGAVIMRTENGQGEANSDGRQPAAVHLLQRQRRVGLAEPDQDRRLPRHVRLAADQHRLRALGRGDRRGEHRHELLQRRAGHGRWRGGERRRQVGDEQVPRHGVGLRHEQPTSGRATSSRRRRDRTPRTSSPSTAATWAVRSSRTSCSSSPTSRSTTQRVGRGLQAAEHRSGESPAERRRRRGVPDAGAGRRDHLRPAVQPRPRAAHAVPEQHHPREPDRPGGAVPASSAAAGHQRGRDTPTTSSTTGATEYNRTNYDFKVNYIASSKLTMFARYGNSPHHIYDAYALGEAGGGSAAGGSVGLARRPHAGPGRGRDLHLQPDD